MKLTVHRPECGWIDLVLDVPKMKFIAHCSSVYDPFPDITDFVNCLSKNKKYHLIIDQEGIDAEIKILGYKGNFVLLDLYNPVRPGVGLTFYDKRRNKHVKVLVSTSKLVHEFRTVLTKFLQDNRREIYDYFYPFHFNKAELLNNTRYVKN